MTGLHLYALLPEDAPVPPGITGVDEAGVVAYRVGPLQALVSEHPAAPAPSIERLRAHNEVVARAMTDSVTPIPIRFGQFLPDGAALESRVGGEAGRWLDVLARLGGHAEHGIRMRWTVGEQEMHAEPAPGAGSRHMQQLMQRHAAERTARGQAAELEALVRETAAAHAVELRADTAHAGRGELAVALLVAAEARAAYDSAVAALPTLRPDVTWVFTGPWPPYSFVP